MNFGEKMNLNDLFITPRVAQFLNAVLEKNQSLFPQTYLFQGSSYSGKEFCALQFMKALNCQEQNGFCGICHSCKNIDLMISPDIHY